MVWQYLAQGQYNRIYIDLEQHLVLKRSIIPGHPYDDPKRSVRIWNIINGHLTRPAQLHPDGWICPYIEGRQATDIEIHQYLIHIYNRYNRIVIDACSPKNMIFSINEQKVICVDIGMALLMDTQGPIKRKSSQVSLSIWKDLELNFSIYFRSNEKTHPLTIATIKALLVLRQYAPDMNANFLLASTTKLFNIAKFFDKGALSEIEQARLKLFIPISLHRMKNAINIQLQLILEKYGQLSPSGHFTPSCFSRFFGHSSRVRSIQNLIREISDCRDINSLHTLLSLQPKQAKSKTWCCGKDKLEAVIEYYQTLLAENIHSNLAFTSIDF